MKYCTKCGNELFDEAVMCPKCGCAAEAPKPNKEISEKAKNQTKGAIFIIAGIMIIVITIILIMLQL